MSIIKVAVEFAHHDMGLQKLSMEGETPFIAEVVRVIVAGGDLPAHPRRVAIDLNCWDEGPRTAVVRAYVSDGFESREISKAEAQRFSTRLLTGLGFRVVDGVEEP